MFNNVMPKTAGVTLNKQNWNLIKQGNKSTIIDMKLEAKHTSKASQNSHQSDM
jgi:hypothetical protein